MLRSILNASRPAKRAITLIYDVFALAFSYYLAMGLRLGRIDPPIGISEIASIGITITLSILLFVRLGLYRAILRFMAQQALITIGLGIFVSAGILAITGFYLQSFVPRSVPIIYAFAALFFVGTPRLLVRNATSLLFMHDRRKETKTVVIYGAGHGGFQLAGALQDSKFKVVGFVDDNPRLHGTLFGGQKVIDPNNLPELIKKKHVKHILLALGNASRARRSAILADLENLDVSIKTMPDMDEILSGKARIEDIRDVEVEDLLGRDPVKPDANLMGACITNKNVLVTGAGGSIGSELCRQIIKLSPKKLILFELNEYNLYQIETELTELQQKIAHNVEIIGLIGSVQNGDQLDQILPVFEVQTIYHAAAYKHVPIIEHNIIAGVKNNILGTWICAEAAIKAQVESFVMISTDKAVRPTNVMGAAKRVAELILQALSQKQSSTRFSMVRFGNVLGSSGSVVPLFRKQIQNGGPVTVTHPEVIRYFMTIQEAAELVIQAGSLATGGDLFVLDMGQPVNILELAKRMIHLSGLSIKDGENPRGDIQISITGLRPGEKLFEELLKGGNVTGTTHPRILRSLEEALPWEELNKLLTELQTAIEKRECDKIKALLLNAPTDFDASAEVIDLVWRQNKPKLRII